MFIKRDLFGSHAHALSQCNPPLARGRRRPGDGENIWNRASLLPGIRISIFFSYSPPTVILRRGHALSGIRFPVDQLHGE